MTYHTTSSHSFSIAMPCYQAAPANTKTGPIKGYYGDTFEVLCNPGHVTTLVGDPQILNYTNYRDLGKIGFNATCKADGNWNYSAGCVRK